MSREAQARFCERRGVRFPPATLLVVLVHGSCRDVEQLRQEIAQLLAPIGLRLSAAKTRIVHLSEGFDFLGFHIRWQRKPGANQWHVYTLVADRPFRSVKARVRALTRRTSQQPLGATLERLNQILRGWTSYFRHAVAKRTFGQLHHFVWWRIVRWQSTRHRWRWKDVRRWLITDTGRWRPIAADGITLFDASAVPVRRYRYRGRTGIPSPWAAAAPT